MKVTLSAQLNAHFIEIEGPLDLHYVRDGIAVAVAIRHRADGAFASVRCEGTSIVSDSGPTDSATPSVCGDWSYRYLIALMEGEQARLPSTVGSELDRIGAELERVGAALRWRFGVYGRDDLFADSWAMVTTDDGVESRLSPMGRVVTGDWQANIQAAEWATFAESPVDHPEPVAHQLLREAWNLRHTNPRSSLVLGVAAAEVGFKSLIIDLLPAARGIVEDLPAPPLAKLIRHSLPELPIAAAVAPERRCPQPILKVLIEANEQRNHVVHRGGEPLTSLDAVLRTVREFLYLLDLYRGHDWAAAQLSSDTLESIGLPCGGSQDS